MKRVKTMWVFALAIAWLASTATAAPSRGRRRGLEPLPDVGAETATHRELAPLNVSFKHLSALRLDAAGNLLAADLDAQQIKVIDPAGKVVRTIKLGFGPEGMVIATDGALYVAGKGKLAKLSPQGDVLKTGAAPASLASPVSAVSRRRGRGRPPAVSGMAVTDRDLFVAYGSGWSMGSKSKLFRYDLDLQNPKLLVQGIRGCCQRCDIVWRDGVLYLAENAVHRVKEYDRDGKELGRWGKRVRVGLEGFGSCCNPMNMCFDASGTLYTSESGMGRVKRYSTDGKFLGLVGYVGTKRFSRAGHTAAACSNIAIAATPDGSRVYVLDFGKHVIRVLEKKG